MELEQMIPKEKTTLEKILSSYKVRQVSLWALDMCGILISILAAMTLTWKYQSLDINTIILTLIVYMVIHTISFKLFKCYSSLCFETFAISTSHCLLPTTKTHPSL